MRKNTYRILAEGQLVSNDTWSTGLNNNDLIIGPSGAGKTRGYVIPNILQGNESLIVADTKNSLRGMLEKPLKKKGYKIVSVDFTDCRASSWGYNPFDFIRYDSDRDAYCEQDIMTVAACLVPVETYSDPFWDLAARMFAESLIGYVLECLPESEHTLDSVETLIVELGGPKIAHLFNELEVLSSKSFALKRYKMFKSCAKAEKMYSSIIGILAEKISPLAFDGTSAMYSHCQRISFADLGREKTAVFLNVSDTDRSLDRLISLFYTQALHVLCCTADRDCPDHRLPVPVRLMLDDFAANTTIPDFDKIISVIRSREIYVSVILQSLSQLETLYSRAKAMTILDNFDHLLYLGGQDVETARHIGIKANKSTCSVLNMPLSSAWLFERGADPRQVEKFRLEAHEEYRQL